MAQSDASLATVEALMVKSFELSSKSNDGLLALFTKSFEAITVVLSPSSNDEHIMRTINSLDYERTLALQMESKEFNAVRYLSFELVKCLPILLLELRGKNNSQHRGDLIDQVPILPQPPKLHVKEEPDDLMEDCQVAIPPQPPKFTLKEELEDLMEECQTLDVKQSEWIDPSLLVDSKHKEAVDVVVHSAAEKLDAGPLVGNRNEIRVKKLFDTEKKCPECEFRTLNVFSWVEHLKKEHATTPALADIAILCESATESLSSTHNGVYNESMKESDGDFSPTLKKSRTDSTIKANNKRKSDNGNDKSETVSKELQVSKKNDTELECPECEFQTRNVTTWMTHLRYKHSTTPTLAGLALLCECGYEALSEVHGKRCNHGNNTIVIRKRDGPIRRIYDEKTTPQCVLCEIYPKTAIGYAIHLRYHHKSTLIKNGVYLMCSCGLEVRSSNNNRHLNDCNPRQFTLHKLDD